VRLQLDSALVDLNLLLFQNFLCWSSFWIVPGNLVVWADSKWDIWS
jgi:hypothetical protein